MPGKWQFSTGMGGNFAPEQVATFNRNGWQFYSGICTTPLHWAAYGGQKAVAELLIERGANINLKDKLNLTPLDLAVRYGGEDVAELLRQHGAHE